ncbi:MAG: GntR family transcriptional regulator [Spirochaetales bacterium]|nr:GntR family transcriptional regulator [Spirochaetales bacterium]
MKDPILDVIVSDIIQGLYKPGDKLPSENFLAEKYSTPRIKIRKAYEILEDMGYIYSRQGKGRFLRPKHSKMELVINGNESFTQKARTQGLDLKTINIISQKIEYNNKIFKVLNAEKNEDVYHIKLLRIINKNPVAIHSSFIKGRLVPEIGVVKEKILSMYDFLKKSGFSKLESEKTIMSVTLPTLHEQELLCCSPLVPLILFESKTIDGQKQILLYSKILYRSDSFQYVINH